MDNLASLSNEQLLARLPLLCSKERQASADVIVYLAEVDRRKLYLREACSSLFSFCVERLGYSEEAALKRMRVARLYQAMPQILEELKSGTIHLTGLFLLSSYLTGSNVGPLIAEARGKTRRQLELVIARRFPKSDVLPSVTPLGAEPTHPGHPGRIPGTGESSGCGAVGDGVTRPGTGESPGCAGAGDGATRPGTGESHRPATDRPNIARDRVQPLSGQSYRVEFTASAELHAKLQYAQNLLGHAVALGALGEIFERALDELIAAETKRRRGAVTDKARKRRPLKEGSRHVPLVVAREVWERDDHQCTFVDEHGRRCSEKRYVTLEHVDPHARGGLSTAENLCLLCGPHNQDAARREFGEEHIRRKQRAATAYSKTAKAFGHPRVPSEADRRCVGPSAETRS